MGIQKVIMRLFSTSAAGLYMLLFAAAIGVATFIENDFGTSAAQKVVFRAWWFELLLVLFAISLLVNVYRYRMFQRRKWALLTFHLAMVIILIGAGVTRYFGYEGMMHIREGSASNHFLSRETYLLFEVQKDGKKYQFHEPVLFASLGDNHWEESYLLGGQALEVEVLEFIPNPKEVLRDDENGVPVLKIVMGGANGREEYYLKEGDRRRIRGTLFNFSNLDVPQAVNIRREGEQLFVKLPEPYTLTVMATQQRENLPAGVFHPLKLRSLYAGRNSSFVFGLYTPRGRVEIASASPKMESSSLGGLRMRLASGGEEEQVLVVGQAGVEGRQRLVQVGGMTVGVAYGSRRVQLPFSIALHDFIMERYPGTDNASSYASEVTLHDPRENVHFDFRIYMNNILTYGGYRFFQSSFDQDELGTYLSVNYDAPGTLISYLGYALLTLGMLLMFFSRNSRFQFLARQIQQIRKARRAAAAAVATLLLAIGGLKAAPPYEPSFHVVDADHARRFGTLVMQDFRGRFKPMNTYASEILRKLSRKTSLFGLTPEQVVLDMAANPKDWYHIPLIKLGRHEEIKKLLGVEGPLVKYSDFFEPNGQYKLREAVRAAYRKPKSDRGTYDKELMKLDERVNICNMVFSGSFLRVFPDPNDENHTWRAPGNPHHHARPVENDFVEDFYTAYISAIQEAEHSGDWSVPNQLLEELEAFQRRVAGEVLPSEGKVKAEILLNRLDPFSRLMKIYGLLSLVFLGMLFLSVFKPKLNLQWPHRIALGVFVAAFAFHLFGLGLRWYVSGRAPWSNGYESMIYIGFTTVLAGLLFARKSAGAMAATNLLAATILMVAGLSWLDPEITPLVPVLKSYWLTIHVSLEAGSYGFLMLGALIGALNLTLMIFANARNSKRLFNLIKEMSYLSEMSLIAGLVMISIGTYLGGVWANESWGRYWGWDPKETWALVTILVYAFILHMRFIPGFRGLYAYNVATLFGWASVIMTYFGVNYYLSGLHSYAAGDPMPIPPPIFYAVVTLTAISLLAFWKYRTLRRKGLVSGL